MEKKCKMCFVAGLLISLLLIAGCSAPGSSPLPPPTIVTVAGTGTSGFSGDNGPATSAQLWNPAGVAIDGSGNLYIGDSANNRVRKVAGGNITTVAGTGTAGYTGDSGAATSAELNTPCGVGFDTSGNFYIADKISSVIRKVQRTGP